jgi:hypothetical protein
MVAAGLDEGLVLARQDLLRGVHWSPPPGNFPDYELARGRFVRAGRHPHCAGGTRPPSRGS